MTYSIFCLKGSDNDAKSFHQVEIDFMILASLKKNIYQPESRESESNTDGVGFLIIKLQLFPLSDVKDSSMCNIPVAIIVLDY